jgi:hypothetical protein
VKRRGREKKAANPKLIRSRLSKVRFPECCPVCLKPPEDLVSITVIEKALYDKSTDSAASVWMRGKSGPDPALVSGGAAVFWIPTCLKHGSGRLRTLRTKLVPVVVFFVLFYPALYFMLGILNALHSPRPILEPIVGFLVTVTGIMLAAFYGLYPRALERALQFIDIDRAHDQVFLQIRSEQYAIMFMELNAMYSEPLSPGERDRTNLNRGSGRLDDETIPEPSKADEKGDK